MINLNNSGASNQQPIRNSNFIQWVVVALLVGSMFSGSRRAILPMLAGAARFLSPFIIIWLVVKLIKNRMTRAFSKLQDHLMQGVRNGSAVNMNSNFGGIRQERQASTGGGQVLDLCPKCGSLLAGQHQCANKV
jgi:hypothetical protein